MNEVTFIENNIKVLVLIHLEDSTFRDDGGETHLFSYEVFFLNWNLYPVRVLSHSVKIWDGFGSESCFQHHGLDRKIERLLYPDKEFSYLAALELNSEIYTLQLVYLLQEETSCRSTYYLSTPVIDVFSRGKMN